MKIEHCFFLNKAKRSNSSRTRGGVCHHTLATMPSRYVFAVRGPRARNALHAALQRGALFALPMASHECMHRRAEFVPVFKTPQAGCIDAVDNAADGFWFQYTNETSVPFPAHRTVFINQHSPATLHSDPTCCVYASDASDACCVASAVLWSTADYIAVDGTPPVACDRCADMAVLKHIL